MRKNNLFLAFVFICLAMLVAVGSVLGVTTPVQPVQIQAAGSATSLFDSNGNYAVTRGAITKGATFNFFGFDWKVVKVDYATNTATFWMTTPYTTYEFNNQKSANLNLSVSNAWSNGYTSATLKLGDVVQGTKDESSIRAFLRDQANEVLNKAEYSAYRDKVKPGYQDGSNWENDKATKTITYKANVQIDTRKGKIDSGVAFARSGTENVYTTDEETKDYTMIADYTLTDEDIWWLPAVEEVMDGGKWELSASDRNWNETTIANLAWLRTPDEDCNFRACTVACNPTFSGEKQTGFMLNAVDQDVQGEYRCGVRPAIHMDITTASTTLPSGNESGNNGGNNGDNGNKSGWASWFTDDMMKVFFIIICVLGVIGIVLVVIAVVRKARENKQQGN